MKKISLSLFFAVSAGEILSGLLGLTYLHWICKPLLMVTLGLYYFFSADHRTVTVWLAILFSLAGDILLMFEGRDASFFMFGLAGFLLTHIFYIAAYRQHQREAEENALTGVQKIRFSFPVVLAGTGLIVILLPNLGTLKIPVVIYALVLIIMVLNSIFRFGRTHNKSFWLVFGGSILFMLSDSLLAINKFLNPVNAAGFWIMGTYIFAQFFIIHGLCEHVNNNR
jgi:uncharacterized membrane protein YhhN